LNYKQNFEFVKINKPGDHSIVWDSKDSQGRDFEMGKYFCLMKVQDYQTKVFVNIKQYNKFALDASQNR